MKFKSIRDTLLIALIFVAILSLIVSQIYISINRANSTEDALLYSARRSLSFTGIIVRDETIVYTPFSVGSGVLDYTVSDGSRLSNKTVIANVYDSYDQIYYRYRIEQLKNDIALLESAQSRGTTDYAQPEFLTAQIVESYKELLLNMAQGELTQVYDESDDMLRLMSIFNVSTNVEMDFTAKIEELKQELSVCNAALKDPIATVKSGETGYFTSSFDGYESVLNTDSISSLTVDDIRGIIENPTKITSAYDNAIGKVFSGYSWKMVGIIDTADRYFVNEKLVFSFASSNAKHTVTVESVTPTGNGNEAIIVLSCEELDSEIASSRIQEADLVFNEYTGLRVPREAIRFVNDIKGVYVIVGERTEFKKLDVIYEGDDYVLSANISDDDFLNLYDRIILEPIENTGNTESTDN